MRIGRRPRLCPYRPATTHIHALESRARLRRTHALRFLPPCVLCLIVDLNFLVEVLCVAVLDHILDSPFGRADRVLQLPDDLTLVHNTLRSSAYRELMVVLLVRSSATAPPTKSCR